MIKIWIIFYNFCQKFFLRPLKLNLFLFYVLYKKLLLFLYVRGLKLPGHTKLHKTLSYEFRQKIERQRLIREIKANRFQFRFGPLWLRGCVDKINVFLRKNKFILLILLKSSISIICIFIPIYSFILIRGILPVPDRVPYETAEIKVRTNTNTHVDYPYIQESNYLEPQGLSSFHFGFLSFKMDYITGFTLSENSPITLKRTFNHTNLNSNNSFLHMNYYLYPAELSKAYSCVIQVFNERNELITQNTLMSAKLESSSEYSIRNSWRRAFTPNIIPSYGRINEFTLPTEVAPKKLIFKTFPVLSSDRVHKQEQCKFVVSDISFSHETSDTPSRRGMIFIVVDGLTSKSAYNRRLMPKLNKLMEKDGIIFHNHYAQSQETDASIRSLFSSRYPSEIKGTPYSDTLPRVLENNGYKIGAVGTLSNEVGFLSEKNLGFREATLTENSRYNGRYVTEMAGQWLRKNAQDPFFLYVHYNVLKPPYKPPFEYLDIAKLIAHPFGYPQKKQLYLGVVKYFDDELDLLMQKLKDLSLLESVDIVITSDTGAAFYLEKDQTIQDQLLVPLFIKPADQLDKNSIHIYEPSAHLDLFPTISHFMTEQKLNISYRGIDFFDLLKTSSEVEMNSIIKNRNFLFFESQKSAGIFDPVFSDKNIYIRNTDLKPISLQSRIEENSSYQKHYFIQNVSERILKLSSGYNETNLDISIFLKQNNQISNFFKDEIPQIISSPINLQTTLTKVNDTYLFKIKGSVAKNDTIYLNFKHMQFDKIILNNKNEDMKVFLCSEGVWFSENYLVNSLNSNICPYFPVSDQNKIEIEDLYASPFYAQIILKNEQWNEQ